MSPSFDFNREWDHSMRQQMLRLGKTRDQIPYLTYDEFQASLAKACASHHQAPTAIALRKLQPVLDQLSILVTAVTSVAKSPMAPVGFIWGAMQSVVKAASRFEKLLCLLTEMFHELASIVVQLNRYLTLFPQSTELQECTRTLIEEYVGFSVSAFLFFKKWPLYNFLRLFWSTIDKEYKAAKLSIDNHYTRFERSRQYTVDSALIGNSTKIIQMLPTVAVVPALSSRFFDVPFLRNPHFCERDDEILRIWTHFTQPSTGTASSQRTCLLQGLGGVGKTSLALEYSYRYRENYDFVLWLSAETDLAVSNAAATISRKLKLGRRNEAEKEPRLEVERFRFWLETSDKQWLLILDNVENLSVVSAVWPRVDQGHLLLTSQRSDLAQVCSSTIVVNTLDKVSGSRLLLKHLALAQPPPALSLGPDRAVASCVADAEQCKAEAIAAELSGVPLAITFVAGIYASMNLEEILMELQQNTSFASLLSPEASPVIAHYDRPFGITWDTARKQLSSKALRLVQTLAMLSPTGVSEDIILAGDQLSNLSMFGLDSKSQYHSIVSKISGRYLVERHRTSQGAFLLMHRVVQKHILSRLEQDPEEFEQMFDLAVKLILAVFPKQSPVQTPQNDLWEERELVSPHVLNLCKIFDKNFAAFPSAGIEFAEMLSDASSYFWERGLYSEAFQTSRCAEAICSRLGNKFSVQKANIYAIAAAIHADHGISQRSNSWDKLNKALQMRQFHLHAVKPELITDEDITCWGNAWNDIGCGLIDLGFYDVALDFLFLAWEQKKASVICQQQYNHFPESPMNVSLALAGTGRYKESIALMSETTENTDRNFTRDCAVAQQVHFSLASILVSAGRYSDAIFEAREVYEMSIKLFGLSSKRTSDAAYLLATVEQKQGNMERARSILESTFSRLNGWTIEAEARAKYRLGVILSHLEEQDAAAALMEISLESLRTLWSQHGAQSINLSELDKETAFDLLVSMTAGRSTLGKTIVRGDPGLGPLAMLCGKLLKKFRAEPDKSPPRLRDLLNLQSEDSWLRWSDSIS